MDGLYLISCLAILVFLAVVVLVIVILKSDSRKETPVIHSPRIHFERSRQPMESHNADQAKKDALALFRSGDPETRLQAVKLLSALHEVEEF